MNDGMRTVRGASSPVTHLTDTSRSLHVRTACGEMLTVAVDRSGDEVTCGACLNARAEAVPSVGTADDVTLPVAWALGPGRRRRLVRRMVDLSDRYEGMSAAAIIDAVWDGDAFSHILGPVYDAWFDEAAFKVASRAEVPSGVASMVVAATVLAFAAASGQPPDRADVERVATDAARLIESGEAPWVEEPMDP